MTQETQDNIKWLSSMLSAARQELEIFKSEPKDTEEYLSQVSRRETFIVQTEKDLAMYRTILDKQGGTV